MKAELAEFDRPHQILPEAQKILCQELSFLDHAKDGDPVAYGFPARFFRAGQAGDAGPSVGLDLDHPFPEVLVMSGERTTLAAEYLVKPKVMANCLKWLNLSTSAPEAMRDGYDIARTVCGHDMAEYPEMKMVIWYYRDFIATCTWKPQITRFGIARSTIDGNAEAADVFLRMCINDRKNGGCSSEMLAMARTS